MLEILGVKPENEKNELPADCRRGRTVASQGCTTVMEPCTCRTEGDNGAGPACAADSAIAGKISILQYKRLGYVTTAVKACREQSPSEEWDDQTF